MRFSVSLRRWWFVALLLLVGAVSYLMVDRYERRPYTGPTEVVVGEVLESAYHSRGTMTGKSYVRVKLSDGQSYRLPEGVVASVGTTVELTVSADRRMTLEGERVVLSSRAVPKMDD